MLLKLSEVLWEVPLPRSGLATIDYPYLFPSIPGPDTIDTPSSGTFEATIQEASTFGTRPARHTACATLDSKSLHEQSWFYYLSEISALRLINRIIQCFYSDENSSWLQMKVVDMINAVHIFETQLQEWWVRLKIGPGADVVADDEQEIITARADSILRCRS
jgi:hypothetical protein